jgi:hypothetical protein
MNQGWGRHIPEQMTGKIAATWGARAIYTAQQIDLLPDRQSWWADGFSEDDADQTSVEYENRSRAMKALRSWVNSKGLPYLRKMAKGLYTDENRTVELSEGKMHIEANPQGSYGYLYIRAWEAK